MVHVAACKPRNGGFRWEATRSQGPNGIVWSDGICKLVIRVNDGRAIRLAKNMFCPIIRP